MIINQINNYFKNNGFSLIENMIAILIMLIISIAYTALFTNAFTGVYSAGYKSEALLTAQDDLENAIADSNFIGNDIGKKSFTVTITRGDTGINDPINVTGTEIQVTKNYDDDSKNVVLKTFVPDE